MSTIELSASTKPTQRRTAGIAAVAAAVTALVLVCAGGTALVANLLRDSDGYWNWPTETFTSNGYAITTTAVDIADAPAWAFGSAGLNRLRVSARSHQRLFIGIADASHVDRYLRGVASDEVSYLTYHPFQVDYDFVAGGAPTRLPASERFWVKSVSGSGSLSLAWKPKPGNWRAVVMNADGSRGVDAELKVGVRTTLLRWVGIGLLALGAALALVAYRLRNATSNAQR